MVIVTLVFIGEAIGIWEKDGALEKLYFFNISGKDSIMKPFSIDRISASFFSLRDGREIQLKKGT